MQPLRSLCLCGSNCLEKPQRHRGRRNRTENNELARFAGKAVYDYNNPEEKTIHEMALKFRAVSCNSWIVVLLENRNNVALLATFGSLLGGRRNGSKSRDLLFEGLAWDGARIRYSAVN